MPGESEFPAAEAIQGVIGLGTTAMGIINAGKAKSVARELERTRPQRKISQYAKNDLELTTGELANGMSAKVERAYQDATSRQFSSTLSTLLKGGGDVNSVGDIYGKGIEGNQQLAIIQDNLRLNKVNNVIRSYAAMNDEEQKNFEFNQWMPWADKSQANAEARKNAQGQIMQGVNTAGSAAMQYANNKAEDNRYEKYFGNNEKWEDLRKLYYEKQSNQDWG